MTTPTNPTPNQIEQEDIKKIYLLLGKLEANLSSLDKSISRVTYALIGVIAAQIGVKVLGSPVLLDIATAIGLIGAVLLAGAIFLGMRVVKQRKSLSFTGISLVIMMGLVTTTQMLVYGRDLGYIPVDVIYAVRIVQNIGIVNFAWQMMRNTNICKE